MPKQDNPKRDLYEYLKLLRVLKVKPKKLRFVTIHESIGISFTQLRFLEDQREITELLIDMQYTDIPLESAIGIASKVSKLPLLKNIKLNLTDCKIGPKGFQGVIVKLFRVKQLEQLSLIFNMCKVESSSIEHISQRIGQLCMLRHFTLSLRQNNLCDANIKQIGEALKKCPSLTHIDIDLSYNQNLQNPEENAIDLTFLPFIESFTLTIQATKIKNSNFLRLSNGIEYLSLNFLTITEFNRKTVLELLLKISKLNILKKLFLKLQNTPFAFLQQQDQQQPQQQSQDNLDNPEADADHDDVEDGADHEEEDGAGHEAPAADHGAPAAPPADPALPVPVPAPPPQDNNLVPEEEIDDFKVIDKMQKELKDSLEKLVELHLCLKFKSEGVSNILSMFPPHCQLNKLSLKNRFGAYIHQRDVESIQNMIINQESLHSLRFKFSQNQITSEQFKTIISDICEYKKWKSLNFSLNHCTSYQWQVVLPELSQSLVKLTQLEKLSLNLSSNSINGEALCTFVEKLSELKGLLRLKLNLRGNTVSVAQSKKISQIVSQFDYLGKVELNFGELNYQVLEAVQVIEDDEQEGEADPLEAHPVAEAAGGGLGVPAGVQALLFNAFNDGDDEEGEAGGPQMMLVQKNTTKDSLEYKLLCNMIKHREMEFTRMQLFNTHFRHCIPFNPSLLFCDFYY